jgi:high-affinity iron transporter
VGAALLITLREGIEGVLIISILLAYLRQLGRQDKAYLVWWGTGLAVAVSVGVAAVIFIAAADFEGTGEQVFEGTVSMLAVGVLTWMIFWMRRQGAKVRSELQHRVDAALLGGGYALAGLAFVVVLREGVETALFVFGADKAAANGAGGTLAGIVGALIGLVVAAIVGVAIYKGSVKLNMRAFFRVTGGVLLVVAAGLLAFAVGEFQEAGLLPGFGAIAYDVTSVLPDASGVGAVLHSLIGYRSAPTVLEVLAWIGYLASAGYGFFRPHAPTTAPVPTSTAN